jgi:D-sedoheptulose 7-phosphate isomerase
VIEKSNPTIDYLYETEHILGDLDVNSIDQVIDYLANLKGRLFILGVGGSAATASHAVNDFRKIANIQAYAPSDNVAELTARTNDDGFETIYSQWLKTSKLKKKDAILVLSVGGSNDAVSRCIFSAIAYGQMIGATILGIVGRDGGETANIADAYVLIPPLYPDRITPHTEGITSVILHLIVSQLNG